MNEGPEAGHFQTLYQCLWSNLLGRLDGAKSFKRERQYHPDEKKQDISLGIANLIRLSGICVTMFCLFRLVSFIRSQARQRTIATTEPVCTNP
jgi:hypothetical protein